MSVLLQNACNTSKCVHFSFSLSKRHDAKFLNGIFMKVPICLTLKQLNALSGSKAGLHKIHNGKVATILSCISSKIYLIRINNSFTYFFLGRRIAILF